MVWMYPKRNFWQKIFDSDVLFVRGFVEGRYLHDKEILIQARTYKGVPGYHVLTPFELVEHGEAVLLVESRLDSDCAGKATRFCCE